MNIAVRVLVTTEWNSKNGIPARFVNMGPYPNETDDSVVKKVFALMQIESLQYGNSLDRPRIVEVWVGDRRAF
jgi:hypothetical protein